MMRSTVASSAVTQPRAALPEITGLKLATAVPVIPKAPLRRKAPETGAATPVEVMSAQMTPPV